MSPFSWTSYFILFITGFQHFECFFFFLNVLILLCLQLEVQCVSLTCEYLVFIKFVKMLAVISFNVFFPLLLKLSF